VNETFIPQPTPDISTWLDGCERALVHPGRVQDQLRRQGWAAAQATVVAEDYRKRFNEHTLGYSALLVTTGVSALALGTAGHILTGALDGPLHRQSLAVWLSVLICVLPFAVWAHRWARRADRDDPVAVWSTPRRNLSTALLWACGVVGGARLFIYATQLIAELIKAPGSSDQSLVAGAINVSISLSIAGPVGLWSYRFLHRFDGEDPTAPPARRRRLVSERPPSPRTFA
jgi:hypothetical protein